ncbi:MAG TPA: FAD-dependent oxidoreductase [Thermoanaerobaculia bacterium]|nr:FAD-dependent oxidoreductase [Thermoanaerobaculia bacterium]
MSGKRIVIAGGGVIGLCTAYYAAERGHRVTVFDRASEEERGCSYGNAGMIVPSHFVPFAAPGAIRLALKWMWNPESPFYMKPRLDRRLMEWAWRFRQAATVRHVNASAPRLLQLNLAGRACFEQLAREWGDTFGLTPKGIIMICNTEEGLEHETATAAMGRALGLPVETLDAKQLAAMEPDLSIRAAGGIYFPMDAYLTPERFMRALIEHLRERGVELAWNTAVTGWRAGDGRIEAVTTGRGAVDADEFVICGGAWTAAIARQLNLRLPMQAGKGYTLTLPRPRKQPAHAMMFSEARVVATPMGSALRFGGTMEITGTDLSINTARVRGIIKSVVKYLPDFTADDFQDVQPWAGLRPCSPDGLPYIGRFASFANLSVAAGHAMMGLSLGPITGKLMSELLSGVAPSISMKGLSPDRYA